MVGVFDNAVAATQDFAFNLEIEERLDLRRASISALRAAYLLALHSLGWHYVLTEAFNPLREQLRMPGEKLIVSPVVVQPPNPFDPPTLTALRRPAPLESVLVCIAHHLVFLPPLRSDPTFFQRISEVLAQYFQGDQVNCEGVSVDDRAPAYLLDHHPEAVVALRRGLG